jgi:YHS domain-containing protein
MPSIEMLSPIRPKPPKRNLKESLQRPLSSQVVQSYHLVGTMEEPMFHRTLKPSRSSQSTACAASKLLMTGLLFLLAAGCTLNDRLVDTARDPVCGKVVVKASPEATRTYLRKNYYFDSDGCARTFDAHPARYCDGASTLYPQYEY